jgi:hypothetical protein
VSVDLGLKMTRGLTSRNDAWITVHTDLEDECDALPVFHEFVEYIDGSADFQPYSISRRYGDGDGHSHMNFKVTWCVHGLMIRCMSILRHLISPNVPITAACHVPPTCMQPGMINGRHITGQFSVRITKREIRHPIGFGRLGMQSGPILTSLR